MSSLEETSKNKEQGTESTTESLGWINDSLAWGTRALPSKRGLTIDDINVGIYGQVPDSSEEMTRMPRGAFHVPGLPRLEFYPLSKKSDIWADNAGNLYEEAIQRRWMAHIDIPWDSIETLPRELELSMCQLSTELAQQASIETDCIGQWVGRMNYAYHEVKTFLATELYDSGRHHDVFRKRALANGGALGLESPGNVNRRIIESRAGWTETAIYLYLLRAPLTLTLYRYGEAYALNPAEKLMFRLCMQDKARHIAYGMSHIKYAISERGNDVALGLLRMMAGVEQDLYSEMKDNVLWEALAIIFGRGIENISVGMEIVRNLQRDYITEYMKRMRWVGIDKTSENLAPGLKSFLESATQTGTS